MIASNVKLEQLEEALKVTNRKYKGNVIFKRYPEPINKKGTRFAFTLRVNCSKGPGHRRHISYFNQKGRVSPSACWHVHGDYFDNLFSINPNAVITTGLRTVDGGSQKITKDYGNWEDRDIGAPIYPVYFSDSCDCERE